MLLSCGLILYTVAGARLERVPTYGDWIQVNNLAVAYWFAWLNASIGTNMLPPDSLRPGIASGSNSEPTPTIVPLLSTSAAPLQPVVPDP